MAATNNPEISGGGQQQTVTPGFLGGGPQAPPVAPAASGQGGGTGGGTGYTGAISKGVDPNSVTLYNEMAADANNPRGGQLGQDIQGFLQTDPSAVFQAMPSFVNAGGLRDYVNNANPYSLGYKGPETVAPLPVPGAPPPPPGVPPTPPPAPGASSVQQQNIQNGAAQAAGVTGAPFVSPTTQLGAITAASQAAGATAGGLAAVFGV